MVLHVHVRENLCHYLNMDLKIKQFYFQIRFALLLLKRGADKMKPNYAGQTPSQVRNNL